VSYGDPSMPDEEASQQAVQPLSDWWAIAAPRRRR